MELRWLTTSDVAVLVAATELFDHPVRPDLARRFLDEPTHHLCLASVGDTQVGFVSGVEIVHPDKGAEMCLYELGVEEPFRRQGIGAALTRALAGLARERGCTAMWVLTERDNVAAIATYRSTGAAAPTPHVMLEWDLDGDDDVPTDVG